MCKIGNSSHIQHALTHIRAADPIMRQLMDVVGTFTLRPKRRNRFSVLARAIISQQVSTAAARTSRGRLEGILDGSGVIAEAIVAPPAHSESQDAHEPTEEHMEAIWSNPY